MDPESAQGMQISDANTGGLARAYPAAAEASERSGSENDDDSPAAGSACDSAPKKRPGRQPLPRHLKRERVVQDLTEEAKHYESCKQDLRLMREKFGESRLPRFDPRQNPSPSSISCASDGRFSAAYVHGIIIDYQNAALFLA